MIGSAIGGYVDPDIIKQQGPRLDHASQQTARDGIPITIGYGTFPTMGNIIWRAPLVENVITSRERQGKGGPVVERTSYQYTRSFGIGICEGPIAGLLIVKENGVIVYDARTDAELMAVGYDSAMIQQTRAGSAAWLASGVAIYLGSEDQLPDSVYESLVGVDNAVPFRGLAHIRYQNKDLTQLQGAVPQVEFVVVMDGDVGTVPGTPQWVTTTTGATAYMMFADGADDWTQYPVETLGSPLTGQYHFEWGNGVLLKSGATNTSISYDRGESWQLTADEIENSLGTHNLRYVENSGFWGGNIEGAGGSFDIGHSEDGNDWSFDTFVGGAAGYTAAGGHRGLICIGSNNGYVSYSTDGGGTWSYAHALASADMYAVESDGNLVVIGCDGGAIIRTTDGEHWSLCTTEFSPTTAVARISYNRNLQLWLAVAQTEINYSVDGISWFLGHTAPAGTQYHDMDSGDTYFGICGRTLDSDGDVHAAVWTTTDGINLTQAPDNFPSNAQLLTGIEYMPCPGTPIPDAPGFYVSDSGEICGPAGTSLDRDRIVLGTIVADICRRRGLTDDQFDVSELTDVLDGYRIATEGGGDAFIGPLMAAYFFDASEWDGKIHFVKRGGPSLATLTMDDLAEREGDTFEQRRIQEAELLKKNTVSYLDPLATYTPTTQNWERRAGTIQAKGESIVELPVVTDATSMAQAAEKRGKVAWSETEKYVFALPNKFSRLVPTDVITVFDQNDRAHRLRLMKMEEDSGYMYCEGVRDRQAAYIGTVDGSAPSVPPGTTPPNLRGPTIVQAMNLPFLRSVEQTPGIYVAVTGLLPGWIGADIYISADGGITEVPAGRILSRASIGTLVTSIASSGEPIPVTMKDNRSLDSATDAQIAAGENLAAINTQQGGQGVYVSEIIQFQTVAEDSFGNAELYDVDRGALATLATSHFSGDPVVLLNEAVAFFPVNVIYAGTLLRIRAASIGTRADDNAITYLVYDPQEYVIDGNGDDDDGEEGPDPDPGGAGTPGSPTSRSIGPGTATPSLTAGEAADGANSTTMNAAFASLVGGGGGTVTTPAGTYWIDPNDPIVVPSFCALDLETNNTTLRATNGGRSTSGDHKDIVQVINNAQQVEIYGGRLIGFRAAWKAAGGMAFYTPGTSEWGHCIYVGDGAHHVSIYDLTGEGGTGDGLSIGRSSHHVHVVNCLFTNNRRNNISTGGDDILVEATECSYAGGSDGTSPMANIDVEVDGPETFSAINWEISNCYLHHATRTGLTVYKSCNNGSIHDCRIEDNNTQGVYAVDADTIDLHDNSIKRNGVQGLQLTGSCSGWDVDGNAFFSNRTRQYGTFNSGATTTSPTTTQKARHISVASTVSGTTYGTNTYGPV